MRLGVQDLTNGSLPRPGEAGYNARTILTGVKTVTVVLKEQNHVLKCVGFQDCHALPPVAEPHSSESKVLSFFV